MALLQKLLYSERQSREEVELPCEDVEEGQANNPYTEILLLQHHTDIVRILLKINDKRFVSAGDDTKAVIWDVQTGQRVAVLLGHSHPITCLALLPASDLNPNSESLLVSGSSDKQIRIWDAETGCCLHVLTEHGTSVRCLQVLNKELFCAGGETVSLWNRDGQMLHSIPSCAGDDCVNLMIAVSRDRIVSAAGKDLVAYQARQVEDSKGGQLEQIKEIDLHKEAILSLCNVSSSYFASGSVDGMIIIWTSGPLQAIRKLNAGADGNRKCFSNSIQAMLCVQERFLFVGTGWGFFAFDVATEKEKVILQKRRAHLSKITSMGFACGGELLATCSEDKSLRLWGRRSDREETGIPLTPMERFMGPMSGNADLASGAVWEPALLGECSAHSGTVQSFLDFDHEGIVTCGADGLVIIWKNWEMQKVRRNQAIQKLLCQWDETV